MATPNQIILKGDPVRKTAIANESITPGHLIQFVGGSAATGAYLKKHATAGGSLGGTRHAFALEQDYIGQTITKVYAQNDEVAYGVFRPGDEVYALLASGENVVAYETALESNGDGTLRAHVPQSAVGSTQIKLNRVVGFALDLVNASSGASRIKVEVA